MNILKTHKKQFSIKQILPLKGLEGELIITLENRIAALSAAEAVILIGSQIKNIELPYVTINHARWSKDGEKILIGNGMIDVKSGKWIPNHKLSGFIKRISVELNTRIKTISWNKDGTYAAVLLDWPVVNFQETNTVKILAFDLINDVPPVSIPETNLSDVRIVGNYVVSIANEVSVWNFTGQEVARLAPTLGTPFRSKVSENEDYLLLLDIDWTTRIIDTNSWNIVTVWQGHFQDVASSGKRLFAIDLKGQLHAACLTNGILEPIGYAVTGLSATQIVTAGDHCIIFMGMDTVSVHTALLN